MTKITLRPLSTKKPSALQSLFDIYNLDNGVLGMPVYIAFFHLYALYKLL